MRRPLSIGNLVLVMCFMLAVCVGGVYFVRFSILDVRVSRAAEQLNVFRDMIEKAAQGSYEDGLGALAYTVSYYPSGSKQLKGSRLDTIVEQARQDTVASIIEVLKQKGPADLGPDPQPWLETLQEKLPDAGWVERSESHQMD